MTSAATRKICRSEKRSEAMILSMSPPCVDRSSVPRTERKRWIGTATETMVSPSGFWRTTLARTPVSACWTSGKVRPFAGPISSNGRPVLREALADAVPGPLDEGIVLVADRRKVEAQDVAARIERARIEQQAALAVVDARPSARRRHEAAQQRRDPFRVDRELDRRQRVLAQSRGLAGLHLQELVGIDLDRVGLDGRRGRDGAGDDLALGEEALDASLDQALPELVEVEEADEERDEPAEVQDDDAPRQARGGALDERAPGRADAREKPQTPHAPAARLRLDVERRGRVHVRRPISQRSRAEPVSSP